jgi:hypothetical protein
MATKKIKLANLDKEMKGQLNKIPPPDFSLFPMHSLVTFVGRRNSGKTYSMLQLALAMKQEEAINQVFVISPTFDQNRFMTLLEAKPDDVYRDTDNAFAHLEDIERKVEEAAEDWKKELEYSIIYGRWKSNKTATSEVDRHKLEEEGYRQPQPEQKRPKCLLIIDDCSHSQLFARSLANPLVNLCLRHRHLAGVGISIVFALQTYKGLPRSLRLNSCQFALFKTKDKEEILSFFEEVAGTIEKDKFFRIFEEATREPHAFLFVDLCQADDSKVFRRGFDGPFLEDA